MRLVYLSLLFGAAMAMAGFYLGTSHFLSFAASTFSGDGVLDRYTIEQAADFSFKIMCAGILLPVIALLAGPALSCRAAGRRGAALAGVALVILGALYLWLADVPPYYAADLRTLPDEVQYVIPTINLLEKGRLVMVINGVDYPPISPFGFHIILMPFYWLFGTMVGNGIRAVQAASALALVFTFAIASLAVGRKRAILAVILLSANSIFIYQTGKIMPTSLRLAVALVVLLLFLFILRSNNRFVVWFLSALSGFFSGFMLLIHYSSIICLPVFFIILIYILKKRKVGVVVPACLFILLVFAAILPLMLYHNAVYGAWYRTGYLTWYWSDNLYPPLSSLPAVYRETWPGVPPYASSISFSPRSYDVALLDGLSKLGVSRAVSPMMGRLLDLLGLGALYNAAVFMLLLLGLLRVRRWNISVEYKIVLLFLALFILISFPSIGLHPYQEPRLLFPVAPCVFIVCSDAFYSGFAGAGKKVSALKQLVLCILLAFSLCGIATLVNKKFIKRRPFPYRYEMVKAYGKIVDSGAVIISGIEGAYLGHFLADGKDVIWYPVSTRVHIVRTRKWLLFPVASENIPLIREHISRGETVYIDDLREEDYPEDFRKIREAFLLERVLSVDRYAIYRLGQRSSPAR